LDNGGHFKGDFVIGLRQVFFEGYASLQYFHATLYILKTKSSGAFVQFIIVCLGDASSVVVKSDEAFVFIVILGEVNEAGVAMLQNIVHQFLYNAEDNEFLFWFQSGAVVVKAGAGIDGAGTANLLEKIVNSRFQAKVFKGWRHQAVGDISNELDGIVDDLFGVIDGLQLGIHILVDQVFIEVEAGCGEEGTCVVVKVCGYTLPFFFLPAD
jgi:hypothetical protein